MECCDNRCDDKLLFEKSELLVCNFLLVLIRVVSDSDKEDLKEVRIELVEGGFYNVFRVVFCYGFLIEFVIDVINNSYRFFIIKDVFECLFVYLVDYSFKIFELI